MTHLAYKISGFSRPHQLATPPNTKNKVNFIGPVSKICGFGVRIHWKEGRFVCGFKSIRIRLDGTFKILNQKVVRGEFNGFFMILETNKEIVTMLCFVVKHYREAAKALKNCFSLHLLRTPAASCTCFKMLQNFIFLHFTSRLSA